MATRFPHSLEEFHSITGVGEYKLRKYGDVFLKEIENYCRDYNLVPAEKSVEKPTEKSAEKPEKSEIACKNPEREEIISQEIVQNNENSEAEIEMFGHIRPDPESDSINSLEACNLSTKRIRYLDTSIQDWSERSSSARDSREIDSTDILPESETVDGIKTDSSNSGSFEKDSLQRTFSLFTQGLGIDEIADIQGMSIRTVFRQLEQLTLSGNIRSIGRILPPKRQQQIKAALESLEVELDSLLRTRLGKNCQEEEMKFVRALLLSRICFSQSEEGE